jgi:hypothetical protein
MYIVDAAVGTILRLHPCSMLDVSHRYAVQANTLSQHTTLRILPLLMTRPPMLPKMCLLNRTNHIMYTLCLMRMRQSLQITILKLLLATPRRSLLNMRRDVNMARRLKYMFRGIEAALRHLLEGVPGCDGAKGALHVRVNDL